MSPWSGALISTLFSALVSILVLLPCTADAQGLVPPRQVEAVRTEARPQIDGRLDEPAWETAPVASGFLQRDPLEGEPASEPTEVRFLFDDGALYVGARLFDREPDGVIRQLSRRDVAVEADAFILYLDPHHDRLTGAQFAVSAAGVQRDALIYNDNFLDPTWDAVWQSAVHVDDEGWVVEMRIPFSQLRFPRADRYTWGVNVQRIIQRRNETAWLQLVPKNESGLASRMAELVGIGGVTPPVHLQLVPYVTMRAEFVQPPAGGSPFNDGLRGFAGAGLDLKYGLSSNMTLDATFNPDFGQVEVDPAVVNLTQFEQFFEERRPFFTEGAKVFGDFGRSGASEYWSFFWPEPVLFYSRRIGRAPQGQTAVRFADVSPTTTILGAGKIVGRTANGWTLGVLDAVTGREQARVSIDGLDIFRRDVEPLTNYFVGRAQRELGARAGIGILATSVLRDMKDEALSLAIPGRATMAGVDGHFFLDRSRVWVLHGGIAGSRVQGEPAAIVRLQRAEQRYYQRPDAPHVRVDPAATALNGWSGSAYLNRNSGNVTVNLGVWGTSPGFEVNDAGFSTQTDRAGGHALVQLRRLTPDRWARERTFFVSKWWTWNYGRELQGDGWQSGVTFLHQNFWRTKLLFTYAKQVWDDKLTRGGPTVIRAGNAGLQTTLTTDVRRPLYLSANASYTRRQFNAETTATGLQLNLRPHPAVIIGAGPAVRHNIVAAQYLATRPDPLKVETFGARYVFGELGQTEVSMVTRLSVATSPRTSLQVFMQPLISTGSYGAIKELERPRTFDFLRYGIDGGTIAARPGGLLAIDPDGDGPAPGFSIPDPDFNVKSLRVNAVFRWEFRPGSALFFVWTQERRDLTDPGDFSLGRDAGRLFTAPADDVLLVKVSYWLGGR
jgi:hypothetical protein